MDFKELRKKDPKYDLELDEYMKEFGKSHDNFVIESRLAWYFIPDSHKVKLSCDPDVRINRICKREGGKFEDQKEITMIRDKTDAAIYMKIYGIEDMNNDSNFDLTIDTTSITPSEIVEKIINVLK